MELIRFLEWELNADPERTRLSYAALDTSAPASCGCLGCANFLALKDKAFPSVLLSLFASLGIDWNKAAEVYHMARVDGLHHYGGWFHFAGLIIKGPDCKAPEGGGVPYAVPLGDTHFVSFSSNRHLCLFPAECPVVQVDFSALLPWALDSGVEID